jgi:hypothetical protein
MIDCELRDKAPRSIFLVGREREIGGLAEARWSRVEPGRVWSDDWPYHAIEFSSMTRRDLPTSARTAVHTLGVIETFFRPAC